MSSDVHLVEGEWGLVCWSEVSTDRDVHTIILHSHNTTNQATRGNVIDSIAIRNPSESHAGAPVRQL
jgi:hypothetical protein